jgi:4-amino-4-deoxy-L-arabinose transferase-like glycosyltransferase
VLGQGSRWTAQKASNPMAASSSSGARLQLLASGVMRRLGLALLVFVYLGVGVLFAVKTPDWQVPDEPAHYNYIRQLAQGDHFPVLEQGDYDQDYLSRLTSERFPSELSVEPLEYEDHQPPLYYVLATPIFRIFDGALVPLRLFSVLIGAGVVILAYSTVATIFPQRPLLAFGTAAFVAFLPQHTAMMAGVNNDSLAEVFIGLTLWMGVRWIRDRLGKAKNERWLVGWGIVLGLGLVTKTTVVPVAATVAVGMVFVWWRSDDRSWFRVIHDLVLVFGPALLIVAPWWLRNISLYEGLDIYGLANHDAVVVGQPRTANWIKDQGWGVWLERGVTFTFQSFWGQFGWMGVLMPTWLYRGLALGVGALVVGFVYWLRTALVSTRRNAIRRAQLFFLTMTVFFVVLAYLYYNRTFVQHQGRYLFPALIPLALGVALSLGALLRLARCPDRIRPLAFLAPYMALIALDLYALWRLILPALT